MRIAAASAITVLLAAGASAQSVEEIAPPTGRQAGAHTEAPGAFRVLLATSPDGVTFSRASRVLTDQAGTPSIAVTPSGRLFVYYTGAALNGARDAVGVAVSDDHGNNWRYFKINLIGFPRGLPPLADPDVLLEADGTFRLFLTGGIGNGVGIYVATSRDGFNFTYGGVALQFTEPLLDSATTKIGSTYVMYVLRGSSPEMVAATSQDGLVFRVVANPAATAINGRLYVLSGWMSEAGVQRVYAFNLPAGDIRSFTTTDGLSLTADPRPHLTFGGAALEASQIRDPAVARLATGGYLMAYASKIPNGAERAPAAPSALIGSLVNGLLMLQWQAGVGTAPVYSHVIEAGSAPGQSDIGRVPSGAPTIFGYAGVPAGAYYLRVRALNGLGESDPSNEVRVSSGTATPPAAPDQITGRVDGTVLTLSWTASTGATSYVIEAGSGPGLADAAVFDTGSPLTTFTHPAVPRGRTFYLRVRARNAAGAGGASQEVTIGPI